MSSIKDYIKNHVHAKSYDTNLEKLLNSHRDEVIEKFNLSEPTESYWIDCKSAYADPPQLINEDTEFHSSLDDQSKAVVKQWKFFPSSTRQELLGILRYILYLRNSYVNKNKINAAYQNEVRDNIYEM